MDYRDRFEKEKKHIRGVIKGLVEENYWTGLYKKAYVKFEDNYSNLIEKFDEHVARRMSLESTINYIIEESNGRFK
jgi:hypothetical protein